MRSFNIKKLVSVAGLGVALATAVTGVSAQSRTQWDKNRDKIQKQQDKINKQQAKIEQERLKKERLLAQQAQAGRFRVNQGGRWHNVDNRQADLLKQAINDGYRQGFAAGRNDKNARRRMAWTNNSVYRSGTFGYQSYVDRNLYQYYFQQGFQRGYQDGFNNQTRFGNGFNGNVIGSILNGILNLQRF